jgi:MFS transporter, DHA3 family, macrolide efflux protein
MSAQAIESAGRTPPATITTFLLVWFGQTVSLIGSGLTGFALGVWTYQQNGSVTQLSAIAVCNRLPGILMLPLAGALVDRLDRRLVLMLCQLGSGASVLSMALALWWGRLPLWHICAALALNSALDAFKWPALSAATTLLVDKRHHGRAGGLISTGDALGQLLSPLLGGLLVGLIHLQGVFLVDFLTFVFACATLLGVSIPSPPRSREEDVRRPLFRELNYGWTFIVSRPGLRSLLTFYALTNFLNGFLLVLTIPLILSFTTGAVLGTVLSLGGAGLLAGGLLMSAWGGPRRRMGGVFMFQLLGGLCLILAGLRPSVVVVAVAVFFFYFSRPLINGCDQALWQSKVPPEVQGRVFAFRRISAWSTLPVAYVLAGPLADYIFEPLLAKGGALASSVGLVIGTGPGRGISLLFIILGLLTLLMVLAGHAYPRLRLLEAELEDYLPDTAPPEEAGSTGRLQPGG